MTTPGSARAMARDGGRRCAGVELHEPVNHLIRLHFAKQDETLNEALNRLEHFKEKMAR